MTHFTPQNCRMDLARKQLLSPNDLDESTLITALSAAGGKGTDYSDLYFERTTQEIWQLEDQKVAGGNYSVRQGVGIRTITAGQSAFAYSGDMHPRALIRTARTAREMQSFGQDTAHSCGVAGFRTPETGLDLYTSDPVIGQRGVAEKIALLQSLDQRARATDPRIQKVSARLRLMDSTVLVAASDGTLVADVRPLIQINLFVIAEHNGRYTRGGAGTGGRCGFDGLHPATITRLLQRATSTALTGLDARPAPAGTMPVVIGPGFPGVLLHEAVGHGLEGDAHRTRSSVFTGCIGQKIAAEGVTVVDDGTVAGRPGSLNIDDEGTPGQRTPLIENGRLTGLMQDKMHATLAGTAPTGNARRESYARLPMPRMTNTFMVAGTRDPEDIIASVDHGIYATEFGGGTVDITSGRFSFSATKACLIENGRLTAPISGATLIGDGREVLQHISMIGNDLALDEGEAFCGKQGQSVLVGVGQPTIRIDEMVVGGSV